MGAASHRRRRGERGAAAVEFALVSTGFFVLVFGMIDYGFYLNDSLSVRQTVRQAARVGVVDFGYPTSCTGSRSEKTACAAKTLSTARTGATYVKVSAPEGWVKGKPLVVCSIVDGKGIVGLVPLPQGGAVASRTTLAIEVTGTTAPDTPAGDALPAGLSWGAVGC